MLSVGSLFSGIGLLDYGLTLAGLEHGWLCEADPFRRQVLGRRWPGARIYDDVRAVGADAERVDVIAGGFPCKGASTVGKRAGFGHPETRLWREMVRAVGELRPRFVVVENVANILALHDGAVWGEVVGDLAAFGYDVQWDCVPAAAFGVPHLRDRVIAVAADADGEEGQRLARVDRQSPGWPHLGRGDLAAIADSNGDGVRQQSEPERRRADQGISPAASQTAPDAASLGRSAPQADVQQRGTATDVGAGDRGVAVEWSQFAPAVARWSSVVGPPPKPLLRRVDDRRAMRVERSRLSALGDGVQVQLGEMVGRYLVGVHETQSETQKRKTGSSR